MPGLPLSTTTRSPGHCRGQARRRRAAAGDALRVVPGGKADCRCRRPVASQKERRVLAQKPKCLSKPSATQHVSTSSFLLAQHHLLKIQPQANTTQTCAPALQCNPRLTPEPGNTCRTPRTSARGGSRHQAHRTQAAAGFIPEHSSKGTSADPKHGVLARRTHSRQDQLTHESRPPQLLGVPLCPAPAVPSHRCSGHPTGPSQHPTAERTPANTLAS